MKNAHSVAKKKYHDFQLSEQHVTIAAYSGYTVKWLFYKTTKLSNISKNSHYCITYEKL
jgi:hypothetical protein